MAVLELTLVPIGTEKTSVSPYVADAHKAIKDMENIEVELNAMGTVMDGELDDLLEAVRRMQESVFDNGAKRVYSVIKIDDRRDKKSKMKDKIKSVEDKL